MAETITTSEQNTTDPSPEAGARRIEGLLDVSGAMLPAQQVENDATPVDESDDDESYTPQLSHDEDGDVDTAQEETPASQDDVDDTETVEQPSIEPPTSWTTDEKKLFATLPPDVQSTIARRETERDNATNQRMQQIAEQRKAIQADVERANQAQVTYANTLNQLLSMSLPELVEIENTDWVALAATDRDEFNRRQAVERTLRQRVNFMQQQQQQVQQAQQQQMFAHHQEHLARQYEVLTEQIPEFREPEKAKALVSNIASTMQTFGFAPEEIGAVADARVVRVMARLAQLEAREAARKSAMAKKGGQPAPRMLPSTAAPSRDDNQKKKVVEQFARLKRTGSPSDATKLLEQIL